MCYALQPQRTVYYSEYSETKKATKILGVTTSSKTHAAMNYYYTTTTDVL